MRSVTGHVDILLVKLLAERLGRGNHGVSGALHGLGGGLEVDGGFGVDGRARGQRRRPPSFAEGHCVGVEVEVVRWTGCCMVVVVCLLSQSMLRARVPSHIRRVVIGGGGGGGRRRKEKKEEREEKRASAADPGHWIFYDGQAGAISRETREGQKKTEEDEKGWRAEER